MTIRTMGRIQVVFAIFAVFFAFVAGTAFGVYLTNQVCHSKTEDSVITDCNYQNGTWYHK